MMVMAVQEDRDIIGLDSSTRWGTVFDPDEAHQRLLYLASQVGLGSPCCVVAGAVGHVVAMVCGCAQPTVWSLCLAS